MHTLRKTMCWQNRKDTLKIIQYTVSEINIFYDNIQVKRAPYTTHSSSAHYTINNVRITGIESAKTITNCHPPLENHSGSTNFAHSTHTESISTNHHHHIITTHSTLAYTPSSHKRQQPAMNWRTSAQLAHKSIRFFSLSFPIILSHFYASEYLLVLLSNVCFIFPLPDKSHRA